MKRLTTTVALLGLGLSLSGSPAEAGPPSTVERFEVALRSWHLDTAREELGRLGAGPETELK